MAAAKKTPSAVTKKAPAKKAPAKKAPVKKTGPTPAELEDKVFEDIIRRYTQHRDFDMVEDTFDIYGRLLMDRQDSQT